MKGKKVLIIGGTGGLSGELVRQLLEKQAQVWTVTRGNKEVQNGVHSLIADRNDLPVFEKTILDVDMKWDVVYDCICMNAQNAIQDINIFSKVSNRLVVISTDSVYSPYHKTVPQTEEGIYIEEEGASENISYGANKRRMEVEFEKYIASDVKNKLQITLFRPGHIYGKGFKLGCYPENSRQEDLAEHILAGKPLKLVGMGTYIIQPIYVGDLARVMIDCCDNANTYGEIFCIAGPQCIENKTYYEILGRLLGVNVIIHEVPLEGYLDEHPEYSGHLCHRMYDLSKLKASGIKLPDTTLEQGLYIEKR